MQSAMTVLTVVGGLVFSVSCALLVEELIFGGLFKLFFQVPGGAGAESKAMSNPRAQAGWDHKE